MDWFSFFMQGAALGLAAAASPGSFQTYLISQTLIGGWRRGALVAMAPLISDPVIILSTLLVLDQLPDQFLKVIGLAGSLFIFYMAWGLLKSWRAGIEFNETYSVSDKNILLRGALINFLSPGPYLFWALVNGPILLRAFKQSPGSGISFLLGFYGLFIGGMLVLVGVFYQARRLGQKVVQALILVCIIILVGFGLLLFVKSL